MTSLTSRERLTTHAEAAAEMQVHTGVAQPNPWAELSDNGVVWRQAFDAKLAMLGEGAAV